MAAPWHMEFLGPGTESEPELWPMSQMQQCWILNHLSQRGHWHLPWLWTPLISFHHSGYTSRIIIVMFKRNTNNKRNTKKNYFFFTFFIFRAHLRHTEVPRLGVELELQLPAYTSATAKQDPSHICDLHHSSWQCGIPNLLSEAREWTHILMDPSWVH